MKTKRKSKATEEPSVMASFMEDTFIREVRVQYIPSTTPYFEIRKPEDVATFIRQVMVDNSREQFFALYLNGSHNVVSYSLISIGAANYSPVHPREVFQRAIISGAVAIVFAHNHPSEYLEPSSSDKHVTKLMIDCGKLLDIPVLDHVIVTNRECHSLKNNGGQLWW